MKKSALLTAALAGLVVAAPSQAAEKPAAGGEKVQCWGGNSCKGKTECATKSHGCMGLNACKGKGWVKMDKDACLKIKGASLKEPK